jgi:multicomponent Na+:H+ antiporter subunit E
MRAFRPSLPIRPVLVEYRLRVPPGPGPVFMANVVSLLPGSLAAGLDGDRLLVHVLDRHGDFRRELSALERRVADLFGEPLD